MRKNTESSLNGRKSGNSGNIEKKPLKNRNIRKTEEKEQSGNLGNLIDCENDWEDPVFFDDFQLDDICSSYLPSPYKEFAAALSERLETPESAAVLCVLSVIATATQKKYQILIEDDYAEPLNLYVMVAMPPANRKSAIFNYCMKPVSDFEERECDRLRPMIQTMQSDYCSQKRLIENERKRLTVKKANEGAVEKISKREAELKEPPAFPQFFLNDTTTETLSQTLMEQKGKISILSDEGGILDTFSGLYTGGTSNIDVLLKGWDGGVLRIRRKDKNIYLKPTITIFLIVQPVIFENMAKNSNFIGKGFFERFLYCLPKSKIGYRQNRREVLPAETVKNYEAAIKSLLQIPYGKTPISLRLSKRAKEVWYKFQDEIELNLRKGGKLELCQGWSGKLCGQTARIAGLLHLARYGDSSACVNEDTMRDAIEIGRMLCAHASRVFENFILSSDSRIKEAQFVWNIIRNLNKAVVSQREIVYALRHKMVADHIKELLCVLMERNLIGEPIKSANKRTILYMLNPKATERKDGEL